MSADAKLKAYIDRILRCREVEDAAKDDTKSVVGQVVTFLRKREKDGDKLSEQSAKFDLYLDAYERPSHVHTRASQSNDGESYERDSQQHVGRTDGKQHHAAPVPGSDGRGEGADAGFEGQGSGASGSDRAGGAVAGTVDREDEDGGSRHVGGEAHHEVISPETADDLQHPGSHLIGNPEPALGAATRPNGDDGMVRGARTEADAVTAGETAPHSDQPLTGGDHEVTGIAERDRDIPTSNTGEGTANTALPAKPKYVLRPHCLNPGEDCGGPGTNHCWSCKRAMAEKSEVAA